ncbi:MAG: alpha/beta hydrolase [Actinobacteria bacterium]|nr:alpha/beta hydrolase [Actinomycetota bacterium]
MKNKRQDLPTLGRLGARQWPPKSHKFPITFSLDKETMGLLKNINVKLVRFYDEVVNSSQEKARKNEFHWVCEHVKSFDLSFYVPLNAVSLPLQKIQNLLIMLNGLNEIEHIHYSHYDRIGASLALRYIGAVLFPTPFHLNRTSYLEERFRTRYENRSNSKQRWPQAPGAPTMMRKPHKSMLSRPESLFYCFKQIANEITSFARYLRKSHGSTNTADASVNMDSNDNYFYDYLFDRPNLKVHLLGYSLGGLQALFTFLRNPDLFDHCILVNSGASIDDLKTKPVGIYDDEWKEIKRKCHEIRFHLPDDIGDERAFLNEVLFERPFNDERIANVFRQNAHKLLFIAGGADIVSPAEHLLQFLKKEDHVATNTEFRGLNILQVEGLGHPLQRSLDYDRWFPVIISTINQFIYSPNPILKQIPYSQVVKWFSQLKIKNKAWGDWCREKNLLDAKGDQNLDVARIIDSLPPKKKKEFLQYYLISKRYFENDSELLRTLERQKSG